MTQSTPSSRAPLNRGPRTGQAQRETPDNETVTDRTDYRAMMFDVDGYALTHNRNLFAASLWLAELIDSETSWPIAGNELRDYLSQAGYTADHIDVELSKLEGLVAPWLNLVRQIS